MKKLVFRDKTGKNPKNRTVSLEEINAKSHMMIAKKWSCKHFIKEAFTSPKKSELQKWIKLRKLNKHKRDCHLMRQYNTRTGENKIICKVLGELYVIRGNTAYEIVYVNEFKVQIELDRV